MEGSPGRSGRRAWLICAGAASLLVTMTVASQAVGRAEPEKPGSDRPVAADRSHGHLNQNDSTDAPSLAGCRPGMSSVADRLMALTGPGFVGLRTDWAACRIHVEWNERPPAAFVRYAASQPRGVSVTTTIRPWSIERATARAALRTIEADPVFDEVEFVASTVTSRGVELTVAKGADVTAEQRRRIQDAADGVPVQVCRARADGPLLY